MSEMTETARSDGNRMTVLGIIAIILGVLAMVAPLLTGFSIALLLGILVLVGGAVRITWAFQAGSLGRGLLAFVIGALTLLCGIALLAHPVFAAGVLTVLLAVYFMLDGIAEIAASSRIRPQPGWGWLLFGGIVSILLGVMIWTQFPLSGPWAMGILLGIKLFFVGVIMVTAGSVVRSIDTA